MVIFFEMRFITVETSEYMPFGHMRAHTGTAQTNYKFTDQELDPESGLYNSDARMYDPVIGLFVSADSIVPDFADPQTLNRYSYCLNNPLIYVDPSGHDFGLTAAIVGGAIFGAISSGAQSDWDADAMLQGAAMGAVFGAAFYGAGNIIQGLNATCPLESFYVAGTTTAQNAAIHAGAGALSGGVNSAISGGDVGMRMLTGGISAGIAKWCPFNLFSHPVDSLCS